MQLWQCCQTGTAGANDNNGIGFVSKMYPSQLGSVTLLSDLLTPNGTPCLRSRQWSFCTNKGMSLFDYTPHTTSGQQFNHRSERPYLTAFSLVKFQKSLKILITNIYWILFRKYAIKVLYLFGISFCTVQF